MEWSDRAGDVGQLPPLLGWWVIPPNTLDRVWDSLISLQRGETPPCSGCHVLFINRRFWAVGHGEGYLCLEQNVYGKLQEQVEHLQHDAQAGIKCDALIPCQGMDSSPHLASHVA